VYIALTYLFVRTINQIVNKLSIDLCINGQPKGTSTDQTPNETIHEYKEHKLSTLIWFT